LELDIDLFLFDNIIGRILKAVIVQAISAKEALKFQRIQAFGISSFFSFERPRSQIFTTVHKL
jgi:hypothetical protein